MGIQLTTMGALAALMWILAGAWEWSLPQKFEEKIIDWKRDQYTSQVVLKFINQDSIYMQERFAFSLKVFLREVQEQIGIPVHCEIELIKEGEPLTEEEFRYIQCLNRSFKDFTWRIQENKDYGQSP